MPQEKFFVKTESLSLGRRYVANGFCRSNEVYTTREEEAMPFYNPKDAKQFARTWAERKRCRYSVWAGEKRIYEVIPT